METRARLAETARVFLPLGFTAFGGPAAHLAMLEEACVTRRAWVTREHFLDLIGATNLIPGPNSTEMVLHLGYERAGFAGMLVAGACFIGPAVVITALLAWLYVTYGALPDVAPWLVGTGPAVLAIVAGALWRLVSPMRSDLRRMALLVGVAAAGLAGLGEIPAFFFGLVAGGFAFGAGRGAGGARPPRTSGWPLWIAPVLPVAAVAAAATPWKIFAFFLAVGSVLYGSGYVLVAFLEGGLVQTLGWIDGQQLLDAIAVGQFTPGPVLSTATFVGWLLDGPGGALMATAGIFLPSFVFVALLNPRVPRLRESRRFAPFLDAATTASLGLMAAVTLELAMRTPADWKPWLVLALALAAVTRGKVPAPWVVAGAVVLGRLLFMAG